MNIELNKIKIKDLVVGYRDDKEGGVFGYDGRLDIRPPYQREFIYDEKKRNLVIDSVMKGFPLNAMYWVVRPDGRYEVLDGQQRTISICRYVDHKFSYKNELFRGLSREKKEAFENYELLVYFCEGKEDEKISWFERINVAGLELNKQEIRNAVYAGPFLNEAKKYFSKEDCKAFKIGQNYLSGSPIRQDYLEKILYWKSQTEFPESTDSINTYLSNYKNDESASKELQSYFESIITWIVTIFHNPRKEMKGLDWGAWYNNEIIRNKWTGNDRFDIEEKIQNLIKDYDVTSHKGIYEYLLTGEDKHLNIRTFDMKQKRKKYEEQLGKCPKCSKKFDMNEMEGHHIKPWADGGHTDLDNLQMLCKKCHKNEYK